MAESYAEVPDVGVVVVSDAGVAFWGRDVEDEVCACEVEDGDEDERPFGAGEGDQDADRDRPDEFADVVREGKDGICSGCEARLDDVVEEGDE